MYNTIMTQDLAEKIYILQKNVLELHNLFDLNMVANQSRSIEDLLSKVSFLIKSSLNLKNIRFFLNNNGIFQTKNITADSDMEFEFEADNAPFLQNETEELIKALLDQFNRIGIKISNDGILLLLNHKQKSLLGDNSFNIDDFQYKNLYTEYEKAYCLQIIFNRLKRNMNSEIDLMKENQMNNWIYNKNKNISNPEWDSWIKSLKNKGEKL